MGAGTHAGSSALIIKEQLMSVLALLLVVAAFAITMAIMPAVIRKLQEKGIVATDYYKKDLRKVPTRGGIAPLFVVALMLASAMLAQHLRYAQIVNKVNLISTLVVIIFGVFGAVDDSIDIHRGLKIVIPFLLALPLALTTASTTMILPLVGEVDLGVFFSYLIVPLYVMVVANLVNMHSGFNGLACGLSVILMVTLLVKVVMGGGSSFMLSCMLGAALALFWYNRYPSRVFLGNVGSFLLGAAIGVTIVTHGFLVSGFVMLIPHTVNFLMYVYWRVMHKLHPDDERWRIVKFGRVRDDGTLEVPNGLTLKWALPYRWRMTEKQAVLAMYALTIPFCIVAIFIPY